MHTEPALEPAAPAEAQGRGPSLTEAPSEPVMIALHVDPIDERRARRRWLWRQELGLPPIWETVAPAIEGEARCADEPEARAAWTRRGDG